MGEEGVNVAYRFTADRFYLDQANRDTYIARSAAGVLDMPASVFRGDITLGAYKLKYTNFILKDSGFGDLSVRNAADGAYDNFRVQTLYFHGNLNAASTGQNISTNNSDTNTLLFTARDTGVGLVEVARMQGAADPYFQMSLPFLILPVATGALPATPVEGMLAYDVTVHKLKVRTAASWETIVSA